MVTIRRDIAELNARGRGTDSINVFVPPDWTLDAACAEVGPDLFFPDETSEHGKGSGYARLAKQICAGCPVVAECLAYALAYESGQMGTATSSYAVAGVYGGASPQERVKMLRERAAS